MLTLYMAVESLLEIEFFKEMLIVNESKDIDSQVSFVLNKIQELELEKTFKNRLNNFLSQIKSRSSVRAIDKLYDLVNKGLVDEELVKSWKEIRNKSAHGYTTERNKLKIFFKLCNQVTVLFNHLNFLLVGYTGRYTDYSEDGWIEKEFNSLIHRSK